MVVIGCAGAIEWKDRKATIVRVRSGCEENDDESSHAKTRVLETWGICAFETSSR